MPFSANCPCQGGSLEKFVQPVILAILAEESLHGYGLTKKIGTILKDIKPGPGSSGIYKALQYLEKNGLVSSNWDNTEKGPAKHLYSLTDEGSACLAAWANTLENFHESLVRLLNVVCRATVKKKGTCCQKKFLSIKGKKSGKASLRKRGLS